MLMKLWDWEKESLVENFNKEKKELRLNFEKIFKEKEENFRVEKMEMEVKICKKLEWIEEVERELKWIFF